MTSSGPSRSTEWVQHGGAAQVVGVALGVIIEPVEYSEQPRRGVRSDEPIAGLQPREVGGQPLPVG